MRRRHRAGPFALQLLAYAVLAVLVWQVLPVLAVVMVAWLACDIGLSRRRGQVPR